jgi:hypothetical protein
VEDERRILGNLDAKEKRTTRSRWPPKNVHDLVQKK